MGLNNYVSIMEALIILFLLFVSVNYVPNQNWKVLEEMRAGSNSDAVKTKLRQHLRYFKITLPLFSRSSNISPHSYVTLSHTKESITNGFVG